MTERSSKVLEFAKSVGARWPSIEISYGLSHRKLAELELLLRPVESYDFSIVVSGSLGRLEYTDGSDIDWSLLVDGIASPGHHTLLLLESTAIGHSVAYQRVLRNVLKRYLFDDASFWRGTTRASTSHTALPPERSCSILEDNGC